MIPSINIIVQIINKYKDTREQYPNMIGTQHACGDRIRTELYFRVFCSSKIHKKTFIIIIHGKDPYAFLSFDNVIQREMCWDLLKPYIQKLSTG